MSTGGMILVILAVIGYFAFLPAMVVVFSMTDEELFAEDSDLRWKRVYWAGVVASLLALYLIYRMSHMG